MTTVAKKITRKKITKKQHEILMLVLRFRHIQQQHIQQLLQQKHKEWLRTLLNDLVEKNYLFRIYEKEYGWKPSEYCLDKGCIPYLREIGVSERIIKRVYKEKTNSQAFRNRSFFLVSIYLSLLELTRKTGATLHFYCKDELYGITYVILPYPDCYFAITEKYGTIARYFLDIFDNQRYMYKRAAQYFTYFNKKYWQRHSTKPFPKIILICPNDRAKKNINKFITKKLASNSPVFYLSTNLEIQQKGMCKEVLETVAL